MAIGRRGRPCVDAKAREGKLGLMCFAQSDQPRSSRVLQDASVPLRDPARQQARPAFGRHACRVEQILPTDRDAIQGPTQNARLCPAPCCLGLGLCTVWHRAGVDCVAVGMGGNRLQHRLG